MLHRFLEHNLAVIILEAAYMDGYKADHQQDRKEAEEKAYVFGRVAADVAPPELHCRVYIPPPPAPDDDVVAVARVVPDKPPGFEVLVKDAWMQGYDNRQVWGIDTNFEGWVQQCRQKESEPEERVKDRAYQVAVEIIRKRDYLSVEYKPAWSLMVAKDCSIGKCHLDQPKVGDVIEYGRRVACRVKDVDAKTRQLSVERLNCCNSDAVVVPIRVGNREVKTLDPEEAAALSAIAKKHPIVDEMMKQLEKDQVVSSKGIDETTPLNYEEEVERIRRETEEIKTPKPVVSSISGVVEMGDFDKCNSEVRISACRPSKPPKPKIPLAQIKPAGIYKSIYTIVIDDIPLDNEDVVRPGIPRTLIVFPWKPLNVDTLPPEKVAKSVILKELIRDELLVPCTEAEAAELLSRHENGSTLSATNTLGVLDRPVEEYVNTRTGTVREDLEGLTPMPDEGPLTDREMDAYAEVGLGNVLAGMEKKLKMGPAVGPEDVLLEAAMKKRKTKGKIPKGKISAKEVDRQLQKFLDEEEKPKKRAGKKRRKSSRNVGLTVNVN